ncbi:MFS transporter [Novosphingobium sp.]|uniref:spinster family MFS transporter n=1 Tax=Novosphingobium sp. TaxID=1874826 RepID=UPI00286A898F|nr:MFS transporter [Novosphingobium sp.]
MISKAALSPTQGSTRVMLWVLLVVYVFNFLDRQIVNILAEPIRRDLGISDTQIGLMTGLAFALFYTVLGLPIARYADRPSTDRSRLIAGALAIWSAMTALCGFAQSFAQLLLARIGVGVGEAGCTPAAHSLIADRVPAERRASAMAFYALGIPIGSLLGMMLGGYLADTLGWRKAFMVAGIPGLILALCVVLLIKDSHRKTFAQSTTAPTETVFAALGALFKSPAYLILVAAASASSFLSYGKATWTTIFFQRSYGLSPSEVGFTFGLWGGVAGVAGTWLGGWLADRFGRVDRRHVVTAPAIGMALAVPIAITAYFMTDWRLSLMLLMVPTVLNSLYYGPVYSSVQGLVARRHRATASAFLLFCQNLIGLGLGPLFFGMLSDSIKPTYGEDSVRYVLYGAACLGLIPALLFWILRPRLHAELDQHERAETQASD